MALKELIMLCDICNEREAVFFVEQMSAQGKRKINICMSCASKNGFSLDPAKIESSLKNVFLELIKHETPGEAAKTKLCPVCGKSLSSIKKLRRLGCPECYEIFKTDIQELMKSNGITGSYTGSMPRRLSTFRSRLTDRVDLQAKLQEAVGREDYEKAAVYRDYLKALERSAVSGGPEDDSHDC